MFNTYADSKGLGLPACSLIIVLAADLYSMFLIDKIVSMIRRALDKTM